MGCGEDCDFGYTGACDGNEPMIDMDENHPAITLPTRAKQRKQLLRDQLEAKNVEIAELERERYRLQFERDTFEKSRDRWIKTAQHLEAKLAVCTSALKHISRPIPLDDKVLSRSMDDQSTAGAALNDVVALNDMYEIGEATSGGEERS